MIVSSTFSVIVRTFKITEFINKNDFFSVDRRVEVRNLIDNKVITLAFNHLTTECENLFKICTQSYVQYQCRETIVALVKEIDPRQKRLEFCEKTLPKIIENYKNWEKISKNLGPWSQYGDVSIIGPELYENFNKLGHESMTPSNEEKFSIASKLLQDSKDIPIEIPNVQEVCHHCFKPNNLHVCPGSCGKPFHRECLDAIPSKEKEINWRVCHKNSDIPKIPIKQGRSQRLTIDNIRVCYACTGTNHGNAIHVTSPNKCFGCENTIDRNEMHINCIRCSKSFHSNTACLPAGALLLSRTQLICGDHNKINPINGAGFCTVCQKKPQLKNRIQCTECAHIFHKNCNRNRTKCPNCSAGQRSNIVCAYIKRKWWPAMVIPKSHMPSSTPEASKAFGPGIVSLFVLGKNEYRQFHSCSVFPFPRIETVRNCFWKDEIDQLDEAIELAEKLC